MSRPAIVLHIGIHKTGSKSIQHWLSTVSDKKAGLFIPRTTAGGTWHKPVHEDLLRGGTAELSLLADSISTMDARHALVSYEGFFELPNPAARTLVATLAPTRTILFVREQVGYLNSFSNQMIKAHRTSWDDIRRHQRSLTEFNPNLDFHALANRWVSLLDPGTLDLLRYDAGEDSVGSFVAAAGLSDYLLGVPIERVRRNPALDEFGLAVLLEAKRQTPQRSLLPTLVTVAHELLQDHFHPVDDCEPIPNLLDPESIEQIKAHYDAGNRRLHDELGVSLDFAHVSSGPRVDLERLASEPTCRRMVGRVLIEAQRRAESPAPLAPHRNSVGTSAP
jgi:hypothetical protein